MRKRNRRIRKGLPPGAHLISRPMRHRWTDERWGALATRRLPLRPVSYCSTDIASGIIQFLQSGGKMLRFCHFINAMWIISGNGHGYPDVLPMEIQLKAPRCYRVLAGTGGRLSLLQRGGIIESCVNSSHHPSSSINTAPRMCNTLRC